MVSQGVRDWVVIIQGNVGLVGEFWKASSRKREIAGRVVRLKSLDTFARNATVGPNALAIQGGRKIKVNVHLLTCLRLVSLPSRYLIFSQPPCPPM